jgi:hypothetical protein
MACPPSSPAPGESDCQRRVDSVDLKDGRPVADNDETQDGQESEQEGKSYVRMKREDIRALEEAAGKAKQLDQMQKELVFAKAGIDTDSKLGKMLLQTYEGELTKEAIMTEAQEIGLLETQTKNPETTKEERDSTKERQTLNSGATPPGENPVHPRDEAREKAKKVLEEGGKYEHAAGAYLNTLVQRYADGDQRAARNANDRYRPQQ